MYSIRPKRMISLFLILSFTLTSAAYSAPPLYKTTLRAPLQSAGELLNTELGDGTEEGALSSNANAAKVASIKERIRGDKYLKETVHSELIRRIEAEPEKQGFVVRVLDLLTEEYLWTVNLYSRHPDLEEERGRIVSDAQQNVYPDIFVKLEKISHRLETGDLIPNAVTLRLSEEDRDITPSINMDTSKRRPKIAYFPMKGDPWQFGHWWRILDFLADGYDIVIAMEDNGDPFRKGGLSSLVLRETQSEFLYKEVLAPFVQPMRFQRQYRRLYQVDGESILPTLISENLEIANLVEWGYGAGYDHCNWTLEGKDGLDVPYKLLFGLQALFHRGINVKMVSKFARRESDTAEPVSNDMVRDRVLAINGVVRLSIVEFLADSVRERMEGRKGEFWDDMRRWLRIWGEEKRHSIALSVAALRAQSAYHEFYKNGLKALSKSNVRKWVARFKEAAEYPVEGNSRQMHDSLSAWFDKLEDLSRRAEGFDSDTGEAKELAEEFSRITDAIGLEVSINIEVTPQPMDTSSSAVRGARYTAYTVASLPIIKSMVGLRFYPSYKDPATTESDKRIAAEVLGDVIDINFLREEAGSKDGQITEEMIKTHLGEYLSPNVDIGLLKSKLNERLLSGSLDSVFLYEGTAFNSAGDKMRKDLELAYGIALHTVDSYTVKCFNSDYMFNKLLRVTGITSETPDLSDEREARMRIDALRDVVKSRTEEIVTQSRGSTLNADLTLASGETIASMNNIEVIAASKLEKPIVRAYFERRIEESASYIKLVIIAKNKAEYDRVKDLRREGKVFIEVMDVEELNVQLDMYEWGVTLGTLQHNINQDLARQIQQGV